MQNANTKSCTTNLNLMKNEDWVGNSTVAS